MKIARAALLCIGALTAGVAAQMPGGPGGPFGPMMGPGFGGGIGGPVGVGGPVGGAGGVGGFDLGQAGALYGSTVGSNPYSQLLTNSPVGSNVQSTLAAMGLSGVSPFVNAGLGMAGVGMGTIGQGIAQQQLQAQYGQQGLTAGGLTQQGASPQLSQQTVASAQLAEKQQIYLNSLQQNGIAAAFGPVGNYAQQPTYNYAQPQMQQAGASPFFIQAVDSNQQLAFTQAAGPKLDVGAASGPAMAQPQLWQPDLAQIANLQIAPVTQNRVQPLLANQPPVGSIEWMQQNLTPSLATSATNWNQQQVEQAQRIAQQQQQQLQQIAQAQMQQGIPQHTSQTQMPQQQQMPIRQQNVQATQLPLHQTQLPVQQPMQQIPQQIQQQQLPVQQQQPQLAMGAQPSLAQQIAAFGLPNGLQPATVQQIPYTPLSNTQLQSLLQSQLSQLNSQGAAAQAAQQQIIAQNAAAQQAQINAMAAQQLAPPQVQPLNVAQLNPQQLTQQQMLPQHMQQQMQGQQGQAQQPQFPAAQAQLGVAAPINNNNNFGTAAAMPVGSGGLPFGAPAFGASRGLPAQRIPVMQAGAISQSPLAAVQAQTQPRAPAIPPSDVSVPKPGQKTEI